MKEVTDWMANIADTLSYNWKEWFNPFENTQPHCDGLNWYIRPAH